ncbi:MAG: hypothetical protein O2809_11365 [Proteobacteria bacterium]|nr:hypothetical protein [Pseudomonadota bacterium]
MKQKNNNQKKNNNDNKSLSCGERFAYGCVFARGCCCCCFNCFYIVLNVFGMLYCFLRKGLRVVNVRDLVLKVRDLVLYCAGYSTKGAGFSTLLCGIWYSILGKCAGFSTQFLLMCANIYSAHYDILWGIYE